MSTTEERIKILNMIAEGKSPRRRAQLLKALQNASKAQATARRRELRYLRVR